MTRYHVKGSVTYTYREERIGYFEGTVEADSEEEAEEEALAEFEAENILYDDIEIDGANLKITALDTPEKPVWQAMAEAGAPSLFDIGGQP